MCRWIATSAMHTKFYLKRDGFSASPVTIPPANKETCPVVYVKNDSALVTSGNELITPITLVTDAVLLTAGAVFIITLNGVNTPSACTNMK